MKDKYWMIFPCIIILLLISHFIIATFHVFEKQYEQGYIDACKDFYQGKLKYDLITNPDGTRSWQKIK